MKLTSINVYYWRTSEQDLSHEFEYASRQAFLNLTSTPIRQPPAWTKESYIGDMESFKATVSIEEIL